MSFRASFTTDYMYNLDDYHLLREEFSKDNDKFFCVFDPKICDDIEIPIISGKVCDLAGYEYMEVEYRLSQIALSSTIRIVVVSAFEDITLLEKKPGMSVEVIKLIDPRNDEKT